MKILIKKSTQIGLILISVFALFGVLIAEDIIDNDIFRKNVSKTPELASTKAKMNIMPVYVPVSGADGAVDVDENGDETGAVGKPVVITYTDEIEDTGVSDIFVAISRDDGASWKRTNVSKTAERSSAQINGTEYPGDSRKPVLQVQGNRMLVAWTDKFCTAGSPRYSLTEEDEEGEEIPLYEDLYGVAGSQGSVDYDTIKDSEDLGLGEIPYSCVWATRGIILTQNDLDKYPALFPAKDEVNELDGYVAGDIVWYKSERVTSGRRDALQLFMGGNASSGFAIAWQEDPAGLRPGAGAGPGTGFSGATTNHKTDIWYSYLTWADFLAMETEEEEVDVAEDDTTTVKPQALNRMSMPVRISDNEVCNTVNMDDPLTEDIEGAHAYCTDICAGTVTLENEQAENKDVCVTADARLLDGDTGASRPNLFLQKYTKPDGTISSWAILAYEETKGLGIGAPDVSGEGKPEDEAEPDDLGKDSIYHSFEFQMPDTISAGNIVNLPQTAILNEEGVIEETGPIWIEGETYNVEGVGEVNTGLYATENARRIRFILQSKKASLGKLLKDGNYAGEGTPLLTVYKEGMEGKGRPSDIMLRRIDIYNDGVVTTGNPYAFKNFVCDEFITDPNGKAVCLNGAFNMSGVTAVETSADESAEDDGGDTATYAKLNSWQWLQDNLADKSWVAPMSDARAHRGQVRGDFVVMGFSWTPNWAAARNGNDKFDFIIRRSMDGGQSWETTEDVWPDEEITLETRTEPRNVSLLPNNKSSVVEPRIVAVPGTIWEVAPATLPNGKTTPGIVRSDEDLQDPNVFFASYGLEVNWKKGLDYPIDGDRPDPLPTDMYYARSIDQGEIYEMVDLNNGTIGWDWMANRHDVAEAEAQLRMTPAGSKFYACYQSESGETVAETDHFYGSDIWLRKVDYNEDDVEEELSFLKVLPNGRIVPIGMIPPGLQMDPPGLHKAPKGKNR